MYWLKIYRQETRNKIKIQKQKLESNVSKTQDFWSEIRRIKPGNKTVTHSTSQATGDVEISEQFAE